MMVHRQPLVARGGEVRQSAQLHKKSAAELSELYASGDATPLDAVQETLDWLARSGDPCNAIVTVVAEQATELAAEMTAALRAGIAPTSKLFGIPLTVKDITATKGIRTTRGAWAKKDWIPDFDALAVERLRAAGAIIIGKTNTPDGAWKAESGNKLFGPTTNPWDHSVTAGGSSGGAAAAVACGYGPLATGTDGFGSVRVPAAYCGVAGFKPTFGLVPYYPHSAEQLSHFGPIARCVDDLAMVLEVIAGRDSRDPLSWGTPPFGFDCPGPTTLSPKTIGVVRAVDDFPVDPDVALALEEFVESLRGEGHTLVDISLPVGGQAITRTLLGAFTATDYVGYGNAEIEQLDAGLQRLLEWANTISRDELIKAQEARLNYCVDVANLTSTVDFVISPTVAVQPFDPGAAGPTWLEDDISRWSEWCSFTYPWNLVGYPALSIPWSMDRNGHPIGMQIVGHRSRDRDVLDLGRVVEASHPWRDSVAHFSNTLTTSHK
jgi:Asp-tRNA(Asn)/Glu-tRNA(Gln) amidotransferase A subunit family amidase